MKGREILRTIG